MADIRKTLILIISTAFFIGAFAVNTWYNWEMFKYDLNVIPPIQNDSVLGSQGFLIFMNIISNIFNPTICAGYIMAFYLISHRRFEILVFLVWFICVSVFLTFMKSLIQQARPYWIAEGDVKMLEWTCYTQFGCPSGHSMLGLILIQFVIRYFSRAYHIRTIVKIIWFIFGIILQGLVVFSRLILGMHAINQVLFGITLGFYFLLLYYMFMQKVILRICLKTCSRSYRKQNLIINSLLLGLIIGLTMIVTFGPTFKRNQQFYDNISKFQRCKGIPLYQSFQYKCLQDASLIMALFGVIYGLVFLRGQQRLMKVVAYERNSKKYIIRLILSAVMACVPVAIFLNPLWKKIDLANDRKAIMLYFLQSAGLLSGIFVLVGLGPIILQRLKLQHYHTHEQSRLRLFYSPAIKSPSQIKNDLANQLQTKQRLLQQYGNNNDSIYVPHK